MFQGVYGYWATARDWANKQYMLALVSTPRHVLVTITLIRA